MLYCIVLCICCKNFHRKKKIKKIKKYIYNIYIYMQYLCVSKLSCSCPAHVWEGNKIDCTLNSVLWLEGTRRWLIVRGCNHFMGTVRWRRGVWWEWCIPCSRVLRKRCIPCRRVWLPGRRGRSSGPLGG